MKKILFFSLIATIAIPTVKAQRVSSINDQPVIFRAVSALDTANNVDTLTIPFYSIGSHVKSFQVTAQAISGTTAGEIYIETTTDGIGWKKIDSMALSNVPINTLWFPITSTTGNSYQAYIITTGTQATSFTFSYLRREDE